MLPKRKNSGFTLAKETTFFLSVFISNIRNFSVMNISAVCWQKMYMKHFFGLSYIKAHVRKRDAGLWIRIHFLQLRIQVKKIVTNYISSEEFLEVKQFFLFFSYLLLAPSLPLDFTVYTVTLPILGVFLL